MKRVHKTYESIQNIINKEDIKIKYAEEVYELLDNAYNDIGGIKGSGFSSPKDMIENIPFWKLNIVNGKVVAVVMYKDKIGRKLVALGSDFSDLGKNKLIDMIVSEIKTERSYLEISEAVLYIAAKIFGKELLKYIIPKNEVKNLLSSTMYDAKDDKIFIKFPWLREYMYSRKIKDNLINKVMIGKPNQKIT